MTRWAWGIVLLGLAGCDPAVPELDVADYDSAIDRAWCDRAERCGMVTDAALCAAGTVFDLRPERAGVAAGRIVYDADAARRCLEGWKTAACSADANYDWPAACAEVFTGTLPDGETCSLIWECASGNCDLESCEDGCCTGTCAPQGGEGAACAYNPDCAEGLACLMTEPTLRVRTCGPLGTAGARCFVENDCAAGHYCTGTIGTSGIDAGTCQPKGERGEACSVRHQQSSCAQLDDHCDAGSGLCAPRARPGEPCTSFPGQLPSGDSCEYASTCGPDGRCHERLRPGDACGPDDLCMMNHTCLSGACAPEPGLDVCE